MIKPFRSHMSASHKLIIELKRFHGVVYIRKIRRVIGRRYLQKLTETCLESIENKRFFT